MQLTGSKVKFTITANLKHSRGNAPATSVQLKSFPDKRICVVHYISAYLNRTASIRSDRKFFVATTKPYSGASQATLSRWVKLTLQKSGINTTKYGPGSTRSAATNAALRRGVPMATIMNKAAWKHKSTFTKWYQKPITKTPDFQQAILKKQKPLLKQKTPGK